MTRTITINTTHGELDITITGQNMTVLNCSTGENIYSGEVDQRFLAGGDVAQQAAQEMADAIYRSEEEE